MQRSAEWFVASFEFQSAGPLSNDGFVSLLYQNGLDRTGSTAEVAKWGALLANGSFHRAGLL